MKTKTFNSVGLSIPELDEKITMREAYLSMTEFLQSHWSGCWDSRLGAIMGELALWDNTQGDKAPMDASVLPAWIKAVKKVQEAQQSETGYRGADIDLKEK